MSGGDDGVLENLPRERPGTRSAKRGRVEAGAPAGGAAGASAKPRAAAARASAQHPRPAKPRAGVPRARPAPEVPADPVHEAARLAGQAAGAGIRAAARVASGVLGRLPRR